MAAILSDHCISRSVRDSATWLAVTEAKDWNRPLPSAAELAARPPESLTIGYYEVDDFGNEPEGAALDALEHTIALCRSLGHVLVPIDVPGIDGLKSSRAVFDIMAMTMARMAASFALPPEAISAGLEPYTLALVEHARKLSSSRLDEAVAEIALAGEMAQAVFDGVDILLSPTIPFTAFPLGVVSPDCPPETIRLHFQRSAAFTATASLAGWPAMSVPLHWSAEGLPAGSHFTARAGEDALLLRLAFQLERTAPWTPRLLALSHTLASSRRASTLD